MKARLSSANRLRLSNGRIRLPGSGSVQPSLTSLRVGMIGQSNMENMPGTGNDFPLGDSRTRAFNRAGSFYRIGNINDNRPASQIASVYGGDYTPALSDNGSPVRGDGFIYFANVLASGLNVPVTLIERAKGGSSIASWQAGQTNWNTFASAVTAAGGDLDAVIWYQGETDAHNLNPATYKAALANVHQQCMDLVGRNTSNFHFGIVTLGPGSFNSSVEGEFGAMRAVLADYANTTPGAFLAATAHDGFTSDGVHQVGSAFGRIGRRMGKSLLARYGIGTTGAGPRITGATRSGNVVTIAIAHTGGTALMDGAGGTAGTALTGFEFKDNNGVIGYTTAISGNTIVCTLTSTPVGALTMSYAMMNTPHGSSSTVAPTFASIPCDNATYYNSSVGCPLQPCAAIVVA